VFSVFDWGVSACYVHQISVTLAYTTHRPEGKVALSVTKKYPCDGLFFSVVSYCYARDIVRHHVDRHSLSTAFSARFPPPTPSTHVTPTRWAV
jgi:hypothetical protein